MRTVIIQRVNERARSMRFDDIVWILGVGFQLPNQQPALEEVTKVYIIRGWACSSSAQLV
jgi:hypothetical protein